MFSVEPVEDGSFAPSVFGAAQAAARRGAFFDPQPMTGRQDLFGHVIDPVPNPRPSV